MDESVLVGQVLTWLVGCRTQLERFGTSSNDEFAAMGQGSSAWERQLASGQMSADLHLLYVAGHQLFLALEQCGSARFAIDHDRATATVFTWLRNIHEHWDTSRDMWTGESAKSRSSKRFADRFPDDHPYTLSFPVGGGIDLPGGVSLNEFGRFLDDALVKIRPLANTT